MRPMVSLPYSGLQDGNVSEMGDVRIVLASDDEVVQTRLCAYVVNGSTNRSLDLD